MAKPPGMGFLSPGPLFLLPLSQSVGYRNDVASDYGGWEEGRGEGSLPFCSDLLAGQSLPLGLYSLTHQPHAGYKHIYSEWIPAAITDTSFCLSRSCCCCFHNVRSSISASAYRKDCVVNILSSEAAFLVSLCNFTFPFYWKLRYNFWKIFLSYKQDVQ